MSRSASPTGARTITAKALVAFRRAVEVGPRSAEAHNWLGVALSEKSDLPGAIAELQEGRRARSGIRAGLHEPGLRARDERRLRRGRPGLPQGVDARAQQRRGPLQPGQGAAGDGRSDEAVRHLRQAAEGDPSNAAFQYELGQTLRQSGDLPGAAAAFERSLEKNPEQREAYYALGTALKQQLPPPAARPPRRRAPPTISSRAPARPLGRGDLATARAQLTEALARDETHADAHNLLGFVLGQQRELASALPHLERAVALRPQSAEAHFNLGVAPGTAAPATAPWPSSEERRARPRCRRQPRVSRRPRCARRGTSTAPGRACSARSHSSHRPPPSTWTSGSRISSRPIWTRRSDSSRRG